MLQGSSAWCLTPIWLNSSANTKIDIQRSNGTIMIWNPQFSSSDFSVGSIGQQCTGAGLPLFKLKRVIASLAIIEGTLKFVMACAECSGANGCLGYSCTSTSYMFDATNYTGRMFEFGEGWAGRPVPSTGLSNQVLSIKVLGAGFNDEDRYLFVFESVSEYPNNVSAWFNATAVYDDATSFISTGEFTLVCAILLQLCHERCGHTNWHVCF